MRATKDVDVVVEATSTLEYQRLGQRLAARGFWPDRDGPICRWQMAALVLDVMPTDPSILGFGNVWFAEAVRTASTFRLGSGRTIRLISGPVFLATKLEAFKGRGAGDLLASPDLEDLVTVVDGRPEIVDEVRSGSERLRAYLADEIGALVAVAGFDDAVSGHLPQDPASQSRVPMVLGRLRSLRSG